ncbi:M23 family metallopeptidase [Paenibacillus woosongensis]|uniref:M23 family metallopeptidase n=1 Tax=Paenibacillus woosongensis TaxID=307580 RepID=A0AA95I6C5_9BACL|nr:M23 family metallopeptidase [Paenibacillus woosongensis]WHX47582.1 M23 family metallopeptidase [Paenibacillus woosongensis]
MNAKLLICLIALYLFTGCSLPESQQLQPSKGSPESAGMLENIDLLPEALQNGYYNQVYNTLSPDFQSQVTMQQIKELSQSFFGANDTFVMQSKIAVNGMTDYVWLDPSSSKGISAVTDQNGVIWGLQIVNLSSYPATDNDYTEQEYSLPFKGEWLTFWGGSNVLLNYHYAYETQRYAYDFIVVEETSSYEGDPAENESFHAFGREVLAPADGIIMEVVNDVEDNAPAGTMNEQHPAGNYIIIDHQGEYSILAHFKQGSISVQEGQKVKRGQTLGLTGNSGNSSEAHIHFQVSDQPSLEKGKSIRIKFKNDLEPIKGQFVEG